MGIFHEINHPRLGVAWPWKSPDAKVLHLGAQRCRIEAKGTGSFSQASSVGQLVSQVICG